MVAGSVGTVSDVDAIPAGSPVVVHLIGHPGVGKYTVAKELVRLADSADHRHVLVDNHLTSNVIFSVLPIDGSEPVPLSRAVWDRVDDVRSALLQTIDELSPADWSFVFTNVALEGDPAGARSTGRVRRLAAARRSHYVPVRLVCEIEEHLRRVADPARAERTKWRDAEAVRRQTVGADLIAIDHPSLLDLDVTHRSAHEAAVVVLGHVERVRSAGG